MQVASPIEQVTLREEKKERKKEAGKQKVGIFPQLISIAYFPHLISRNYIFINKDVG